MKFIQAANRDHPPPEVDGLVLAVVKPITGRTHQIRVHSQHIGMPLSAIGSTPKPVSRLLYCTAVA
jgi:hypothetical protein